MAKRIQHEPADKHMTLDEIAAFITDARAAGAAGTDVPHARVSFGGKLQQLDIVVDTTEAAAP